jgi:hypothetical protein
MKIAGPNRVHGETFFQEGAEHRLNCPIKAAIQDQPSFFGIHVIPRTFLIGRVHAARDVSGNARYRLRGPENSAAAGIFPTTFTRGLRHGAFDLTPLVTHRFALDDLTDAYHVFSHQREGVMKVAI